MRLPTAAACCVAIAAAASAAAGASPVGGAGDTGIKYLLLDDRNVIDQGKATLTLGKVTKHNFVNETHDGSNDDGHYSQRQSFPLIREERDYEMRFDNMQPNIWYDPLLKKWRAWYSAFTNCSKPKESVPYCNNAPQTCGSASASVKASRGTGFLYAESDDGISWVKPHLGLVDWKGSKDNNLIELDGMTTQVYLDEQAPPDERYKIVTGSNGLGAIAVSPDGIRWNSTKDLEQETFARWDTPKNLVWDPVQSQWIVYVRSQPTEGFMRIQSYIHSQTSNFMGDWAPATPTGLNSSLDYQPDGLVAWPYEGIFIGVGNVFNPTQVAGAAAKIGQVNMVLGWSADGRRWKWLLPTESIVPLGSEGDFDACGVFGAKQDPMRTMVNDTLRLYYTGCNGPFFGSRGCGLGLATLQRDGWAGYTGGTVQTAPVRVVGPTPTLQITVEGPEGGEGVRVGILGSTNFSVNTCDPIKGQQTDATVTWNGVSDLSQYLNGAVTLIFYIPDDATAFAFKI